MQSSLIIQNLVSAPVLFFFLGVLAVLIGSDLEIPSPLPKLFSLYLLLAIGFKGGVELAHSGLGSQVLMTIAAAVAMSLLVPITSFYILRTRMDVYNAAAVAASYGSISAVTFITAQSFLNVLHVDFDGFMVAALALMESPAIVVGVVLAKLGSQISDDPHGAQAGGLRWREVLQEAFLNGSVFLLIGSLVIGYLVTSFSPGGLVKMEPFTDKLFYGALCFFLLDMGLMAARNFPKARGHSPVLMAYAVLGPCCHAGLALALAVLLGLPVGDGALLMVLAASASYIAVPAVLKYALPESNPSLYFGLSLGVTFPLNILFGIPMYVSLAQKFLG
jgi:hypothetical protein